MVAGDADRGRLSPGERILALLLNLLTERQPLDAVADAFQLTDVPLLLGADVTAADLTDDALGRALVKLAAAGAAAVFSAVAARAYAGAGCIAIPPRAPCTGTTPRRTGRTG